MNTVVFKDSCRSEINVNLWPVLNEWYRRGTHVLKRAFTIYLRRWMHSHVTTSPECACVAGTLAFCFAESQRPSRKGFSGGVPIPGRNFFIIQKTPQWPDLLFFVIKSFVFYSSLLVLSSSTSSSSRSTRGSSTRTSIEMVFVWAFHLHCFRAMQSAAALKASC